jgi:gluconate 2-dehydrogenase gamma chain
MNRRELLKRTALLLGGTLSGSVSRAVLAGAGVRKAEKPFFNAGQRKAVDSAAELIIPTTDTPGALAAGVPDFIEMMVSEWYTDTERELFLKGLAALDGHCRAAGAGDFARASVELQTTALQAEEEAGRTHPGASPMAAMSKSVDETTPFFFKLKELTVLGYYTSEVGAKQELVYNPMPMRYDGSFPFTEVGRQWSY